jgi:hypothetical protein
VLLLLQSGRRKTREPKEENVTLGPTVREGEYVFGVAHIFASFNDTFIVSGRVPYRLSISIRGKKDGADLCIFGGAVACDGSVWTGDARSHHW